MSRARTRLTALQAFHQSVMPAIAAAYETGRARLRSLRAPLPARCVENAVWLRLLSTIQPTDSAQQEAAVTCNFEPAREGSGATKRGETMANCAGSIAGLSVDGSVLHRVVSEDAWASDVRSPRTTINVLDSFQGDLLSAVRPTALSQQEAVVICEFCNQPDTTLAQQEKIHGRSDT
jgi:hypothetical protein